MPVSTDIVNIALRRIGGERISSLQQDTSIEAVVARDIYDEARRDLLNSHNWNFAIKRTQFQEADSEDTTTAPNFGWDYAYRLPDDLIRLISVHPIDNDNASVEYRLEFMSTDDRVLLTNSNQIFIRYVWDMEDPNVMSASFRDALAWRLARDFALAIYKNTGSAEMADQMERRTLARAKAIDGIEDWPERMAEGTWITDRFGHNTTNFD